MTTVGAGGLYIHVPFCGSICSYCHFPRTAEHGRADRARYVAAVPAELELRRQRCAVLADGRRALGTVYVGGGTPSCLEPELFTRLVDGTVGSLPTAPDLEFTVEANPESFTTEVADAWRAAGVNRVSLGVQSLDPAVLARLGRDCDPTTALEALARACHHFDRVSADWILGPGVDQQRLGDELAMAVDLGVEHISLYILELHGGTRLAADVAAGRTVLPADEETEAAYLGCVDRLAALGLAQYEVSNFARPGAESRHNGNYWRGVPFLGLGPGAHGCWGRRRYGNIESLPGWHAALAAGHPPEVAVDEREPAARRLEQVILALRTCAGVPLARLPRGALAMQRGLDEGLWTMDHGKLALTPRGFLRIDTIEAALARHLT
ncbi:coproporphyrinogen III oxidase [bacterium]|nr:MAG: coproporphyrinogen III oxidase [bacterium]